MRRIWSALSMVICLLTASAASATEVWQTVPQPPPLPRAAHRGVLPINGIRIWYAEYGSGPPVILLHGGLANSEYWSFLVPELARHHRVIVMDSRGHGRSSRDATPYSYDLMTDDVVALMNRLHIRRASIVGWSDGGIIGLDMAIRYPARLNRLFAYGANATAAGLRPDVGDNPTFASFFPRLAADYQRLSPTPGGFDALMQAIGGMWATQPNFTDAQLAGIRARVAIVDGEHEEGILPEHTAYMARQIPGAQLIIVPGVSHFGFVQDPSRLNRLVLEFLDAR